jgi:hypothetical protein
MKDVPVTVLITPPGRESFSSVQQRVEAAGLQTERSMPTIGVVTGTISPARISEIRKIDGVSAVEQEGVMAHPPLREGIPQ